MMMDNLSDESLWELTSKGDSKAEDELIRRYIRVVRMLARPLFLAGADNEDLIQEGMFGLIHAIRRYDPSYGVPFRAYSELCIRRRMLTAIRDASGNKNVSLDDCLSLESPLFDETQSQEAYSFRNVGMNDPEDTLIRKEEVRSVFDALSAVLSEYERTVLGFYLNGMSYREIAEITKKPEKAVDNAVQRIRRKLARQQKTRRQQLRLTQIQAEMP